MSISGVPWDIRRAARGRPKTKSTAIANLPSIPEGQEDVPVPATPAAQQPQVVSSENANQDGMEKSSSSSSDSSSSGKIEIDNTSVGNVPEPMQARISVSSNELMTPQRGRH